MDNIGIFRGNSFEGPFRSNLWDSLIKWADSHQSLPHFPSPFLAPVPFWPERQRGKEFLTGTKCAPSRNRDKSEGGWAWEPLAIGWDGMGASDPPLSFVCLTKSTPDPGPGLGQTSCGGGHLCAILHRCLREGHIGVEVPL